MMQLLGMFDRLLPKLGIRNDFARVILRAKNSYEPHIRQWIEAYV
jgi:hypothetical protein